MTVIAELLLPFTDAGSLSHRDASETVRKRVVVSLAFVDTRALHDTLFAKQHLDWQGVQDYLGDISYTADDWMHILSLMDFVNEIPPRQGVSEIIANAMAGVSAPAKKAGVGLRGGLTPIDALRMCFARARVSVDWDTLCKALIMCNLCDMDHLVGLTGLLIAKTGKREGGPTAEQVAEMVRFLPSCRHTQDEYMDAFAAILRSDACQIRSHLVMQSFDRRDKMLEVRRQQTIRTGEAFKRPSLTAMLAAKAIRQGTGHNDDSFFAVINSSKLSANANLRVRQVAYYLACLPPHDDRSAQIAYAVGGDPVVHACLMGLNIVRPDTRALCDIINASHHTGPPFDALRRFRESCVGSSCLVVASTGRRTVHWTTIFKLYLAAHCRPELWKDLWSDIIRSASAGTDSLGLGLHSSAPEAENSVQSFARSNPMALRECVQLMLNGT